MEIPAQIKELVDLALKDAIITPLERKTIVNEAIECGIRENEINKYINQKLDEKLGKRGKDQLKACPHCGAQIPLVADNCPYCGYEYAKADVSTQTQTAGSHAAAVIESENQRIENERQNLEYCPSCGHPYPLISNICPACKHVLHHSVENDLNIQRLVDKINGGAERIKKIKVPSMGEIIFNRGFVISIFLILVNTIYLVKLDCQYLHVLSGIFLLFGCAALGGNTKSPRENFEKAYQKFKSEIEIAYNHINVFYGEHQEAKKLLMETSEAMRKISEKRGSDRQKTALILLLAALALMIPLFFITKPEEF